MRTLAEIWPVFGLKVTAGPIGLAPLLDSDIPDLVALAAAGIHDPDAMPFYIPWSTAPEPELERGMVAYYWRTRAEFKPESWTLDFVVRYEGEVVGSQGISTKDYAVTRTGETGSWLGRAHHGRGIGTLMRQTICAFLFDHLDAVEIASAAFLDNPASLAVSRKVGYQPNGQDRLKRRDGEVAVTQRLMLRPETFVRHAYPLHVEGVEAVRRLIGLDSSPSS